MDDYKKSYVLFIICYSIKLNLIRKSMIMCKHIYIVSVIYYVKKYILGILKIMKNSQIRPSVVSYFSLNYLIHTRQLLSQPMKC